MEARLPIQIWRCVEVASDVTEPSQAAPAVLCSVGAEIEKQMLRCESQKCDRLVLLLPGRFKEKIYRHLKGKHYMPGTPMQIDTDVLFAVNEV